MRPQNLRKCALEQYTILSLGDLNQILGCDEIQGDIVITNFDDAMLKLEELRFVDGLLEVKDSPALVRLEMPMLQLISGEFKLQELTSLCFLQVPSLAAVREIQWNVLPILSAADINWERIHNLSSVLISDTSLSYIIGINSGEMELLNINNNRFLESVSSDVESVTDMLHIAANGDHINVDLPHLHSTKNLSIHNVDQLELGELRECKGLMSLNKNHLHSANFPKLGRVAGTLSLVDNKKLSEVLFDKLKEIDGGLVLANNTQLTKIDFFPELTTISGALELVGPIKEVEAPNLKLIRGSAKIKSTDESFDCLAWSKSGISSVIRGGKNECTNSQNQNYVANTPTDPMSMESLLAMVVNESRALSVSYCWIAVILFVCIINM